MWLYHRDPTLSVLHREWVSSAQWNPRYSCPHLFWYLCIMNRMVRMQFIYYSTLLRIIAVRVNSKRVGGRKSKTPFSSLITVVLWFKTPVLSMLQDSIGCKFYVKQGSSTFWVRWTIYTFHIILRAAVIADYKIIMNILNIITGAWAARQVT